jgi:hypothetical protein
MRFPGALASRKKSDSVICPLYPHFKEKEIEVELNGSVER